VKETIRDISRGRLLVPGDADPGQFILSDGKVLKKAETPKVRTLDDLFRIYETSLPDGAKEETTRTGEQIHMKHLRRHLGGGKQLQGMKPCDLQSYIVRRAKDTWNSKQISGATIKKEITTFRLIWNWAREQGHLTVDVPVKGLQYPKRDEREPFKTFAEIEQRIARGGLTDAEANSAWECLYLTRDEIDAALQHVKEHCRYPFIYPMIAFAAYTGARRSEILRSRIDDFKFTEGVVQIREKKKRKNRGLTFRHVDLSDNIVEIMQSWFAQHPGGDYTISATPIVRGKQRETPQPLTAYEAHHHFSHTFAGSGWEKLRGFHVFRHSFASNAARVGVPEAVIDAWMGHQTEEMRVRYRHLFPEQRRSAMKLIFGEHGE